MISGIRVDHVSFGTGGKRILDAVSCEVSAGEVLSVTGINGSGKTTLLKIIAGVLRATAGSVKYVLEDERSELDVPPKKTIGMSIGNPVFYPMLTCYEALQYHASHFDSTLPVEQILTHVGLEQEAHRSVESISLGQRMRLAIGRALITKPKVLVFDEPDNGLDQAGTQYLSDCISQHLSKGGIAILSSHSKEFLKSVEGKSVPLELPSLTEENR